MQRQGQDIYHLAFGQSPFPIPDVFVKGLQEYAGRHEYLPVCFVNPCLHYLDLVEFELFDALSSRILGWFGAWINFSLVLSVFTIFNFCSDALILRIVDLFKHL